MLIKHLIKQPEFHIDEIEYKFYSDNIWLHINYDGLLEPNTDSPYEQEIIHIELDDFTDWLKKVNKSIYDAHEEDDDIHSCSYMWDKYKYKVFSFTKFLEYEQEVNELMIDYLKSIGNEEV